MRTSSSELLPIFRSDGQGRLLARVYLQADRPANVAALARELRLNDGALTREANRLERAGLLVSQRVGRSRVLAPNKESPYYPELYGLLLKAFGPVTVIARALSETHGVQQAFLYGSWAARYQGMSGPDPADIDVLVIGSPSAIALARISRRLEPELGREVNIAPVTPDDWRAAQTGFLRQVKSGPLVELDLVRHD